MRRPPAGTGSAALRGAVLIAASVLIGLALLAKGVADDGSSPSPSGTNSGASTSTSSTTVLGSPTSTTAVPRSPADVTAKVLNGIGAQGLAGKGTETLTAANYSTLDAGDTTTTVDESAVYFTAGYAAEAGQIVKLFNLPADTAQSMPSPVPPELGDVSGANVIVVLGSDAPLASDTGSDASSASTASSSSAGPGTTSTTTTAN
ncbi:MAG: LytR C-terminal domain-containing protein [Acidimicrobiia bacterium]